jgi:hypothetical protein
MDPTGTGSLFSADRIEFPSTTVLNFMTVNTGYVYLFIFGQFYDGADYIGGAIHLNKDDFSFTEMIYMDTNANLADVYVPTIVALRDDQYS